MRVILPTAGWIKYGSADDFVYDDPMNTCPCIESVKTLITTGKWEGGGCECGKKLTLCHLLIAGAVALLLAVLVRGVARRRG